MSGKLQERIAALARVGTSRCLVHNGIALWTDGHILVPGSDEKATELGSIGTLWDKTAPRTDFLLQVADLTKHGTRYYRGFTGGHTKKKFFINEAYWRLVQELGDPYATMTESDPIAIREGGELQALVMCCKDGGEESAETTTDAQVFESFAVPENDWYLQGAKKLRAALASIESDIERKEEYLAEVQAELEGLESQADGLRRKIKQSAGVVTQ